MNETERSVCDIMIDVFSYPHVPYWFTLRQVSSILKKSLGSEKAPNPAAVLVFDEKYNLMGYLDIPLILGHFSSQTASADKRHTSIGDTPAGDLMITFKVFADSEDSVMRASDVFMEHGLSLLPVLERQKKLVGIVRNIEVFTEMTKRLFNT